jgi:hypothetical protein
MPKGPQSSIGSEAEQTHSAEGNLQVCRVLQEVLNFSGATVISEIQCVPLATEIGFHFWTTSCMLVQ